jgi:hypothetical protein
VPAWILRGRAVLAENRVNLVKAALAVLALTALVNRFWLHWCSITPADLIAGVLVAITVAATGQRPGASARLFAMWALWGMLCLAGMLLLRRVDHIGAEVIVALGFSAVFADAAHRELADALPPAPTPEQTDAWSGAARRS